MGPQIHLRIRLQPLRRNVLKSKKDLLTKDNIKINKEGGRSSGPEEGGLESLLTQTHPL
jgi:hypothetical protein